MNVSLSYDNKTRKIITLKTSEESKIELRWHHDNEKNDMIEFDEINYNTILWLVNVFR